jgi:hypothetical protein
VSPLQLGVVLFALTGGLAVLGVAFVVRQRFSQGLSLRVKVSLYEWVSWPGICSPGSL